MRILADMHISPNTVQHLMTTGHDAIRVDAVMPNTATDREIVEWAGQNDRVVLTQDLDFSDIIALSGAIRPSLITLRLSDSRVENVNRVLESVLPQIEDCIEAGIVVTVEDDRFRIRQLPIQ